MLDREYESERVAHSHDFGPFPHFAQWIRETIREQRHQNQDMDANLILLSTPPHCMIKCYKRMVAYGNHFRVRDENTAHTVTYDTGIISVFEHRDTTMDRGWMEMGYVGELTGI